MIATMVLHWAAPPQESSIYSCTLKHLTVTRTVLLPSAYPPALLSLAPLPLSWHSPHLMPLSLPSPVASTWSQHPLPALLSASDCLALPTCTSAVLKVSNRMQNLIVGRTDGEGGATEAPLGHKALTAPSRVLHFCSNTRW